MCFLWQTTFSNNPAIALIFRRQFSELHWKKKTMQTLAFRKQVFILYHDGTCSWIFHFSLKSKPSTGHFNFIASRLSTFFSTERKSDCLYDSRRLDTLSFLYHTGQSVYSVVSSRMKEILSSRVSETSFAMCLVRASFYHHEKSVLKAVIKI